MSSRIDKFELQALAVWDDAKISLSNNMSCPALFGFVTFVTALASSFDGEESAVLGAFCARFVHICVGRANVCVVCWSCNVYAEAGFHRQVCRIHGLITSCQSGSESYERGYFVYVLVLFNEA